MSDDYKTIRALQRKAYELRLIALETALCGKKGHIPPAYSWAEVAVALFYGNVLRLKPKQPKWNGRDRFILSKGHACLILYAALADLGFFAADELKHFAGKGSLLPGHPDMEIPGIEACSGSLGHGLGAGAGMALAGRMDRAPWRVFVVLGDSECNEGSVWEAAMFAGHQKLNNLIAIVDRNGLGATDFTDNYLTLEPLAERFRAFGWKTVEVDGHDLCALIDALITARDHTAEKPCVLIAKTIKGKGVPFMENSSQWHHRMPKGDEITKARKYLEARISKLLTE